MFWTSLVNLIDCKGQGGRVLSTNLELKMNTTTTTTETKTIETKTSELLAAVQKQARIATAAAELEAARKFIRQVSISGHALRNAGLSTEAADDLLRTLRSVEAAIEDASRAADNKARSALSETLDLVDGLSK
jgi:hypothetical protein